MIATVSAPDNPNAPASWLIVDRRSGSVFNPGLDPTKPPYYPWVAFDFTKTLAPADVQKYLVARSSAFAAATVRAWPTPERVLIRAYLGDTLPGNDLVAVPYAADGTSLAGAWDYPMSLSRTDQFVQDTNVIKGMPGVALIPPTL